MNDSDFAKKKSICYRQLREVFQFDHRFHVNRILSNQVFEFE